MDQIFSPAEIMKPVMSKVTVTGMATPRSGKTTWVVRVDGAITFGSFDKAEAEARAALLRNQR